MGDIDNIFSRRLGLKRALSIRETTNTEIVYIEAERFPLSIRISKQQLKFWKLIKAYLCDNPEHPLSDLIAQCKRAKLKYLAYYENLEREYENPLNAQNVLRQKFLSDCAEKIRHGAENDAESRLGVYLQVNPRLEPPNHCPYILEFERIILSRYRSGSHSLRIETGRLANPTIPREDRLCSCLMGVQSLKHCMFECPLLQELRNEYVFTSIEEAFKINDIVNFFMKMGKILNITS